MWPYAQILGPDALSKLLLRWRVFFYGLVFGTWFIILTVISRTNKPVREGTHRVLAGYSQGTPSALTTTSSVPNEPVRVGYALMRVNAVAHALADRRAHARQPLLCARMWSMCVYFGGRVFPQSPQPDALTAARLAADVYARACPRLDGRHACRNPPPPTPTPLAIERIPSPLP